MSTMMTVKYDLIYVVMRLAPSFGRTRGKLRGAAGYRLEWPASRTRACLAEAEEAEETARCAWRASKRALRELWVECRRIRRCTTTAEVELARLKRMRAREVARAEAWQDLQKKVDGSACWRWWQRWLLR